MITYKVCESEIGALTHECDACASTELGNIRSFALIKAGTVLPSPATLIAWTALIESGDIIIIPESRGTFDGGAPKMGAGYGDEKERLLGHDYVLAVKDPAYKQNSPFWSAVEKEKWNLAWRTETQLSVVKAKATITAKAPVTEDIEAEVVWEVEAKWFSQEKPVISDAAELMPLFACFDLGV